jgi:hypothetical protein
MIRTLATITYFGSRNISGKGKLPFSALVLHKFVDNLILHRELRSGSKFKFVPGTPTPVYR